jgi:hypothetical protein
VPVYIILSYLIHILDTLLIFSGKKYISALHLVEMDPEPDPDAVQQVLDAIRDPQPWIEDGERYSSKE